MKYGINSEDNLCSWKKYQQNLQALRDYLSGYYKDRVVLREYPYIGESECGIQVVFTSPGKGLCIESPIQEVNLKGFEGTWNEDIFKVITRLV